MQPAARVGDMHVCPMVTPGTPPVPHVGGPVLPPGGVTVLIGGQPAARMGDMCTCVGPPDVIVKGSPTVLICGQPAARMGDNTAHGGVISTGLPTVLIGMTPGAGGAPAVAAGVQKSGTSSKSKCPGVSSEKAEKGIKDALSEQEKMLKERQKELKRWNKADQARFKKWFGSADEKSRKTMSEQVEKTLKKNQSFTTKNFEAAEPKHNKPGLFGYVYPSQDDKIYLGEEFCKSPVTGTDSKAGTLCHEMSHYDSVGKTKDHVYGTKGSLALAKKNPSKAIENADSFQYWCEGL